MSALTATVISWEAEIKNYCWKTEQLLFPPLCREERGWRDAEQDMKLKVFCNTLYWSCQTCCDWLTTRKVGAIPLWEWFWKARGFQVCRQGAQLRQISFCCHYEQLKPNRFLKAPQHVDWREPLSMTQSCLQPSRKAELQGFLNQLCQEVPRFAPLIPQVFPTASVSLCKHNFSCSRHKLYWEWLGREPERGGNRQEMREWFWGGRTSSHQLAGSQPSTDSQTILVQPQYL